MGNDEYYRLIQMCDFDMDDVGDIIDTMVHMYERDLVQHTEYCEDDFVMWRLK